MANLHLRAVETVAEDAAHTVAPIFFVIQRANGSWSPAAKIISVFSEQIVAEMEASRLKNLHPQQAFGVAALRSEARPVAEPIIIVRVVDQPGPEAA